MNDRDQIVFAVDGLQKWFPVQQGLLDALLRRKEQQFVRAVDGITLSVRRGEIVGIVGESGSGKTTVGMTALRLYEPTGGTITFMGEDITHRDGDQLQGFRQQAQIIFQNPYESLNPRATVFESVVEPLRLNKIGTKDEQYGRVLQALERAEITPPENFLDRFPHELSGGQRQRLAIARAIVIEPKFLVADEPVSMLDVSIRAGILNLLKRLSQTLDTAILYISHDLATVRYICDRTITMYAGKVVELGKTDSVIHEPLHPYTQLLIKAIPEVDPDIKRERVLLEGEVPNLVNPPAGCRFHPRCPFVKDECRVEEPRLREVKPGHWTACHLY
jgi:peptide/nickel transport system ATP-binding protein